MYVSICDTQVSAQGFPGGPVIKNPPVRGYRFDPWSGKIPHAMQYLRQCATATESTCLEPVLYNKRGHCSEKPTHRSEGQPLLTPTRESPYTATKTQDSLN